jgi:hypothetical protein
VICQCPVKAAERLAAVLETYDGELSRVSNSKALRDVISRLRSGVETFAEIEDSLVGDFESRHGGGRADSIHFRRFMAEYQCEFPAAHLDDVRATKAAMGCLADWLESPFARLAFERVVLVTGAAGSGKTHGICDSATVGAELYRAWNEFRQRPESFAGYERHVLKLLM